MRMRMRIIADAVYARVRPPGVSSTETYDIISYSVCGSYVMIRHNFNGWSNANCKIAKSIASLMVVLAQQQTDASDFNDSQSQHTR